MFRPFLIEFQCVVPCTEYGVKGQPLSTPPLSVQSAPRSPLHHKPDIVSCKQRIHHSRYQILPNSDYTTLAGCDTTVHTALLYTAWRVIICHCLSNNTGPTTIMRGEVRSPTLVLSTLRKQHRHTNTRNREKRGWRYVTNLGIDCRLYIWL